MPIVPLQTELTDVSTNIYLQPTSSSVDSTFKAADEELTMRLLMLMISVVVVVGPVSAEDLSNGWGTDYAWVDTLEAAQNKAIQQWK